VDGLTPYSGNEKSHREGGFLISVPLGGGVSIFRISNWVVGTGRFLRLIPELDVA
jgi:hypothetical protein